MGFKFSRHYRELQQAIEKNHHQMETLKSEEQKLAEKLVTASICREFEESGLTYSSAVWHVNKQGKLEAAR